MSFTQYFTCHLFFLIILLCQILHYLSSLLPLTSLHFAVPCLPDLFLYLMCFFLFTTFVFIAFSVLVCLFKVYRIVSFSQCSSLPLLLLFHCCLRMSTQENRNFVAMVDFIKASKQLYVGVLSCGSVCSPQLTKPMAVLQEMFCCYS